MRLTKRRKTGSIARPAEPGWGATLIAYRTAVLDFGLCDISFMILLRVSLFSFNLLCSLSYLEEACNCSAVS